MKKKKIAIIGGGVAGLTAAYRLNAQHEIKLFEKTRRIGGNAFSFSAKTGDQFDIAVAAFGKAGYDEFYSLLSELGIETNMCANTYMSFLNLDTNEGLYLTPSLKGSRQQGLLNLIRPKTIKTIAKLFLGVNRAQKMMDQGKLDGRTLGDCIMLVPEFTDDTRRIFLSALCLLSSMKSTDLLDAPAAFFLNKLRLHNDVISPRAIYSVRCVAGGTRRYVNALACPIKDKIEYNSKIEKILRPKDKVEIIFSDNKKELFDSVIFATPANVALKLIARPTSDEKRLLEPWSYTKGRVVVHRDHAKFPPRNLIQAYNFLYREIDGVFDTSVNGGLWFQPNVSNDCNYISSQHPNFPIREDLIEFDDVFYTPSYSFDSYGTIGELPTLNGVKNTYFCGSYFGYGLHNDAVSSALKVASCFSSPVISSS